ncbi:MAG: type II toxin-antitoxin system prevent-host-death family antitoxin [Armatimonadota bacterium]
MALPEPLDDAEQNGLHWENGELVISVRKARDQFSDLLTRAAYLKERIVLKRYGKRIAALVPIEDIDQLEEQETREDLAAVEEVQRSSDYDDRQSLDDFEREAGR